MTKARIFISSCSCLVVPALKENSHFFRPLVSLNQRTCCLFAILVPARSCTRSYCSSIFCFYRYDTRRGRRKRMIVITKPTTFRSIFSSLGAPSWGEVAREFLKNLQSFALAPWQVGAQQGTKFGATF